MSTRAGKILELGEATQAAANDAIILEVVANSSSSTTEYIKVKNLFGSVPSNTVFGDAAVVSANTLINRNKQTPANSTITISGGTIFYDSDYLYIAVANNTVKRVALSSF